MINKISRMITIFFLIIAVMLILFFLNGMTVHTVAEKNIETHFLNDIAQKGITEGSIIEEVVATYIKSLYFNKWKQYYILQLNAEQNMQYSGNNIVVDDHIFEYGMKYQLNEKGKLFVMPVEPLKSILAIRLFGIGVVVAAAVIGRIVGIYMQRKR